MRITLRWERNRDHQLIALLGRSGVRAVCLGGLRHHPEKFDHRTGEVWPPVLCHVRRRSFPGGMGNGADSTVGKAAFSSQLSAVSFQLPISTRLQSNGVRIRASLQRCRFPFRIKRPLRGQPVAISFKFFQRYSSGGSAYQLSPGASGRWAAPPRMKRSRGENARLYWSELISWSRCSGVRSRMPRIARLTAWRRSGGNCLNC